MNDFHKGDNALRMNDNTADIDISAYARLLLSFPSHTGMGHDQRVGDDNLGLGWLYYALGRIARVEQIVVIGSFRGFAPLIFAKAQDDNRTGAKVLFIDPSLADSFWEDPEKVERYFKAFGRRNVQHFRETTQTFCVRDEYASLSNIGLLLIDGHHTYEQARYDFDSFEHKMAIDGIVLLHDSAYSARCNLYGGAEGFFSDVPKLVRELRQRTDLQVWDLHRGAGIALVSRIPQPGNQLL